MFNNANLIIRKWWLWLFPPPDQQLYVASIETTVENKVESSTVIDIFINKVWYGKYELPKDQYLTGGIIEELILHDTPLKEYIRNKDIIKTVYVPLKSINFVVTRTDSSTNRILCECRQCKKEFMGYGHILTKNTIINKEAVKSDNFCENCLKDQLPRKFPMGKQNWSD